MPQAALAQAPGMPAFCQTACSAAKRVTFPIPSYQRGGGLWSTQLVRARACEQAGSDQVRSGQIRSEGNCHPNDHDHDHRAADNTWPGLACGLWAHLSL